MKKGFAWLNFIAIIASIIGGTTLVVTIVRLFIDKKITWEFSSINLEEASKVGDFIGGFTGIFWTIAGVILLFITLRLQSREFKENRNALSTQQFEGSFYNMLNILSEIRVGLTLSAHEVEKILGEKMSKGVDGELLFGIIGTKLNKDFEEKQNAYTEAKKRVINEQLQKFRDCSDETTNIDITDHLAEVKIIAAETINSFGINFRIGHYIRFLSSIINTVIDKRKDHGDERQYLDIIVSQLSITELVFIFYAAIAFKDDGPLHTKDLYSHIRTYRLVSLIDKSLLLDSSHYILYPGLIYDKSSGDEARYTSRFKDIT